MEASVDVAMIISLYLFRMEEEMYWEHQRRYEMMEYFEWHRMGGPPGMMPPRFPGPMGPGPMVGQL